MVSKPEEDTFFGLHFHFRGEASERPHVLPARNLIQALEGLQRTIHLVAMMREGREVRSRARITHEIEEHFQLHCATPTPGSYYQSTFVADPNPGLLAEQLLQSVADDTRELMKAVADNNEVEFKHIVPDSAYRGPILSSLGKMFNEQRGPYRLDVEDRERNIIATSSSASEAIEKFRKSRIPENTYSIVAGFFNRIDFKEKKFSIQVQSGYTVNCFYDEEVEPVLLENARDLIQVVGMVEVDDNGRPKRITDVQEVHAVDKSDIDVLEVLPDYLKSISLNNMQAHVSLSDDNQTYFASIEDLGIESAAYTRDDLIEGLRAEIDFLWKQIAMEDDNDLTEQAIAVKNNLLKHFKEMP